MPRWFQEASFKWKQARPHMEKTCSRGLARSEEGVALVSELSRWFRGGAGGAVLLVAGRGCCGRRGTSAGAGCGAARGSRGRRARPSPRRRRSGGPATGARPPGRGRSRGGRRARGPRRRGRRAAWSGRTGGGSSAAGTRRCNERRTGIYREGKKTHTKGTMANIQLISRSTGRPRTRATHWASRAAVFGEIDYVKRVNVIVWQENTNYSITCPSAANALTIQFLNIWKWCRFPTWKSMIISPHFSKIT